MGKTNVKTFNLKKLFNIKSFFSNIKFLFFMLKC